ncbi:muts domain V-domain-containing protein [Catenaria anguillulae PL171]|uniref:Muts domain V-domain-containing protein n=1 Tax=Catenaria anguillulae PL171 TaxID=765915 RepID=A0A1Y2H8Q1_9FUNG|nr:muts domain V-domain-containing protein [Catenaria anguillulae PL171]
MSQRTPKASAKALGAATDSKVQSNLFKFFGKKPTPSKAATSTPTSTPAPTSNSQAASTPASATPSPAITVSGSAAPAQHKPLDHAARSLLTPSSDATQAPAAESSTATPKANSSVKSKPAIKRRRIIMDSDEDQDDLDHDVENHHSTSSTSTTTPSAPPATKRARTSATPAVSTARKTPSAAGSPSPFTATPSKPPSKRSKSVVTPASKPAATPKPGSNASDWLLNPRDKEGRFPHEEGYDKSTLWIPKSAWERFSNFEKQFWEVKGTHWDCVVFFQKGKFFELYATDADLALQLFDLKVSDNGRGAMRMAGVPESAFEEWAAKFIARGYRVAKVVQSENAIAKAIRDKQATTKADKIIHRELTCVLTPGTLAEPHFLTNSPDPIYCTGRLFDVASSRLYLACLETETLGGLDTLLTHTQPREIVVQPKLDMTMMRNIRALAPGADLVQVAVDNPQAGRHLISATWAAEEGVPEVVKRMAGEFRDVETSEVQDLVASALGRLIMYLQRLKRHELLAASATVEEWTLQSSKHMVLDGAALAALAVIDGDDNKSLFHALDYTVTPTGRRLLRSWLAHPLRHREDILERQRGVVVLGRDHELRKVVKGGLKAISVDLERSLNVQARKSLAVLANVVRGLQSAIALLEQVMAESSEMQALVHKALKDVALDKTLELIRAEFEAAIVWTGGASCGVEFNPDTDAEYLQARQEVDVVEDQIEELRADTQRHLVPAGKVVPNADKTSSTKSVARYQTRELKDLNRKFSTYIQVWRAIAHAAATVDVMYSLAVAAEANKYTCVPDIVAPESTSDGTSIVQAVDLTHPCFSQHVPNDISLGSSKGEPHMLLLSGSNAGGKSTVQRTIATASILAQIGSLVPATSFRLVPFDSIHTRIGARDDLAQGMSTLALELHEMSRIIKHATRSSLVLVDELGRGTSTYDGMAIASATLFELILRGCCCVFTTHYHSLVHDLQSEFASAQAGGIAAKVKCMQMEVENMGHRKVKFCYK